YLHQLVSDDPKVTQKIIGMEVSKFVDQFHAWLLSNKDDYSVIDAQRMLKECYVLRRKSVRDGAAIRKVWVIAEFTPDAKRVIEIIIEEGEEHEVLDEARVVED